MPFLPPNQQRQSTEGKATNEVNTKNLQVSKQFQLKWDYVANQK